MAKSKLSETVRKEECQAEHRTLSYCRTAETLEICNETIISDCKLNDDSFKVHKSFKDGAAR